MLQHNLRLRLLLIVLGALTCSAASADSDAPAEGAFQWERLPDLPAMLGGMEAVVWTDVAQTVVLLGGVFCALAICVAGIDGGFTQLWRTAHQEAKVFEDLDWSWDLTAATVWVTLVGNFFANLMQYTASQDVVQRYITTSNERQAARSVWTNAAMILPSMALFFTVGTALFVFYKTHPDRLDPTPPQARRFRGGQSPPGPRRYAAGRHRGDADRLPSGEHQRRVALGQFPLDPGPDGRGTGGAVRPGDLHAPGQQCRGDARGPDERCRPLLRAAVHENPYLPVRCHRRGRMLRGRLGRELAGRPRAGGLDRADDLHDEGATRKFLT